MSIVNKSMYIYEDIKKRILNGEFDDSHILPTEKELESFYTASRNTIRKAIRKLNADGLVYSKTGSSNVILERIPVPDLLIDSGNINRPSKISNSAVKTKVLTFESIKVDEQMSKISSFKKNQRVYHVVRLRYINNVPTMIDDSYFNADLIPLLTESIVEKSIYEYIQKKLHKKIVGSKLVDRISLASELDHHFLDLENMNCVGLTQNWSYLETGEVFEFTEIHFSPKNYVRTRYIAQNEF